MSSLDGDWQLAGSPQYALVSFGLHAGAAGALVASRAEGYVLAVGLALLAAAFLRDLRYTGLRAAAGAVVCLSLRRGTWCAERRDGTRIESPEVHATWLPGCVLLRLRPARGATLAIVAPRDAVRPDDFRRLRVAATVRGNRARP